MTMQRRLVPLLAVLALAAASCGDSEREVSPLPGLPEPNAAAVLDYLEQADYRDSWELWPGLGERYPASEPHGKLLTTYLNPVALEAVMANEVPLPNGAIIMKENYNEDGSFFEDTVMYKVEGYNPEHNDWFWLQVGADGSMLEGKVEGCQACHGTLRANDYVMTGAMR